MQPNYIVTLVKKNNNMSKNNDDNDAPVKKFIGKFTPDIVDKIENGLYAVEPLGKDLGYNIWKSNRDEIINTEGIVGIEVVDRASAEATVMALPYVPKEIHNAVMSYEYEEPKFEQVTIHGLHLLKIPKGTVIYKGLPFLEVPEFENLPKISFYSFDPRASYVFSVGLYQGGLFAWKVAEDIYGFLWDHHNTQVLIDSVADPDIKSLFGTECIRQEYDDVLAGMINYSNLEVLNRPWKVNKNARKYIKMFPTVCPNKLPSPNTDKLINEIVLKLGKLFEKDPFFCTYQPIQASYTSGEGFLFNELVFEYGSKYVVRDLENPFDIHHWKIPEKYKGYSLASTSIRRPEDYDTIIDFVRENEYTGDDIKPKTDNVALRCMSYNVHMFRKLNLLAKGALAMHMNDIIQKANPDVVIIEEFPTPSRIKDKDYIEGYNTYFSEGNTLCNMCAIKKELKSAVVWRRFRVDNHRYYCIIRLESPRMTIVGTHLSIYKKNEEELRRKEIAEMLAIGPDIVLGDFNEIAENLPKDLHEKYNTSNFKVRTTPFNTVDHILVDKRHKANFWTVKSNYSDHIPVFVDIYKK